METHIDDLDITFVVAGQLKKENIQQDSESSEKNVIEITSDDDDLDNIGPRIEGSIRVISNSKSMENKSPCSSPRESESESEVKQKEQARTRMHEHGEGEKVIMTEDEEDDPYQRWKEARERGQKRRPNVSKHEGPVAKRQKFEKGAPLGASKRSKGNDQDKVVGKRAIWKEQKREREYIRYGEDEEDDSSQLMPHLAKRKEKIDRAKASKDEAAGLKLPPSYNDVEFSDDERMADLSEKPDFKNLTPCAPYRDVMLNTSLGIIPAPIAQWLRDYQVQGVRFLHENFVYQRGGILGDDMGLGKTVQVIAFLTAAFGKTGDERDKKRMRYMRNIGDKIWYPRVLIVCPGTLMDNWKNELDTWGWWTIYTFHGGREVKEDALRAAMSGSLEIMITTYATYKNNREAINRIPWDCVIADECHQIKERKSDITKAMNEVNALCRIGLTGTAIQNKYEELWTILNWCNPGGVGPLDVWNRTISKPLRLGQSHDATHRQLGTARKIAKQLVQNLLPRMFLRRMKSLIADQLPKKSDKAVFCQLTPLQAEAYENFLNSEAVNLIKDSGKDCDCGKNKRGYCCYQRDSLGKHWRELVFPCVQNAQKLCNHIGNFIPLNEEPMEKRSAKMERLQECLPDHWQRILRRTPMENYMDPELCGKWIVLQKLLSYWYLKEDKVLIFSYSIRHLDILRQLFTNTSYNVSYLDGKMSLEDRVNAVNEFNSDPKQFVFLISTRAGGVGLNITAANKVVIFDPNWNPTHDLQAQDRAYRIGQRRDVEVFRLISAGTIEEIVYSRQIYKQQQANIGYGASYERRYFSGVMGEVEKKGELFGLQNLFTYRGDNIVLKEIMNKTNVAESRTGVAIVGFDSEEAKHDLEELEEEDSLSQLEALAGAKPPEKKPKHTVNKTNAIQAILAEAGIQYTHENSEVIGTSAVEQQLSRRALEITNDYDMGDSTVFAKADLLGEEAGDDDDAILQEGQQVINYKFRPPEDVMVRQFCTMSQMFKFETPREFALVVESWTQKQRRAALDKFYKIRREALLDDSSEKHEDMEKDVIEKVKSNDEEERVEDAKTLTKSQQLETTKLN